MGRKFNYLLEQLPLNRAKAEIRKFRKESSFIN